MRISIFALLYAFNFSPLVASENRVKVSWHLLKRSSEAYLQCGHDRKLIRLDLKSNKIAYEILPDKPAVIGSKQLTQSFTTKFFECDGTEKNSKWIEKSIADLGLRLQLIVATKSWVANDSNLASSEILVSRPITNQQIEIDLLLAKLFTQYNWDDYRQTFSVHKTIQAVIVPIAENGSLQLEYLAAIARLNYSLNIENEVPGYSAQSRPDPAYSSLCASSGPLLGTPPVKISDTTKELDEFWSYRILNPKWRLDGENLEIQFRIESLRCIKNEETQKYEWQPGLFPKNLFSFVGPFHGFYGWKDFDSNSSINMEALKDYVDMTSQSYTPLPKTPATNYEVHHQIPVKLILQNDYRSFSAGDRVLAHISLGIRSNYQASPTRSPFESFWVNDIKLYPIFKMDLYLQK